MPQLVSAHSTALPKPRACPSLVDSVCTTLPLMETYWV